MTFDLNYEIAECSNAINDANAPTGSPSCRAKVDLNFLYSTGIQEEVEVSDKGEESRTGRKRKRNPENWKKKHIKKPGLRKNSPLLIISNDMECCKRKCLQSFSSFHLNTVSKDFQELFYDEQNIYLNGLLHRRQTKKTSGHPRKPNPVTTSSGKRMGRPPAEESQYSFEYTLRNESGVNVRVCQKAFCAVHGFGPKRLTVLRRKLEGGQLEHDRRGKHSNHPNVSEDVKDLVRNIIIRSYPSRHSHYSRNDNSERVYLPAELSIARLHRNFLEKHDPEYITLEEENKQCQMHHQVPKKLQKPLVSEHLYHDIFVTEFNIYFGYPRTDSCSTCDALFIQIEAATDSQQSDLEKTLEKHQTLAQEGYKSYRYDRELSINSWENVSSEVAGGEPTADENTSGKT